MFVQRGDGDWLKGESKLSFAPICFISSKVLFEQTNFWYDTNSLFYFNNLVPSKIFFYSTLRIALRQTVKLLLRLNNNTAPKSNWLSEFLPLFSLILSSTLIFPNCQLTNSIWWSKTTAVHQMTCFYFFLSHYFYLTKRYIYFLLLVKAIRDLIFISVYALLHIEGAKSGPITNGDWTLYVTAMWGQ